MARKTDRPTPNPLAGPCIPAADLTAFAHGELPEWHRAEISRHILGCGACRAEASGASSMFERLAALGADGDAWRGEVAAAGAVLSMRRRASIRAIGAGLAAAGVLVAGFAAFAVRPNDAARKVESPALASLPSGGGARAPLSPDEKALLASQNSDGHWSAGAARVDEAATGLALLALAARRPQELRAGEIGRATAAATSWLLLRQRDGGGIGRGAIEASARDAAVATAALLEVYAATGEPALHAPIDRSVRDLARRAKSESPADDPSVRWTRLALERARSLGWDRLDSAIERVGGTSARASEAGAAGWLAAVGGLSDDAPRVGASGSSVERAIRVLRRGDRG